MILANYLKEKKIAPPPHITLCDRRTVIFYQVCTLGYPAYLTEPLGMISSLGLHLKVIFSFQIFSNVRIKPYP